VLVNLLPGARRSDLQTALREVATELSNSRSGGGASVDRYNAYIRWANEAVRRGRHMVPAADLERLILTKRYWLLQSMPMKGLLLSCDPIVAGPGVNRTWGRPLRNDHQLAAVR
jgi:hypothetical protein